MTRTRGLLAVGTMMTRLVSVQGRACAVETDQASGDRVRTNNAAIATLIEHASERSQTFRGLIETINASDGIVFLEKGTCNDGRRACFVTVTMAGQNRMLWVKVDTRGTDCDIMGLIGHELRHTVEVLGDHTVTGPIAMYFFYSQVTDKRSPPFETDAASKAGEAVRDEVRQTRRCTKIR
jgi:hypothetical protein